MWQKSDVRHLLLIAGVCSIMATASAADYRRYVVVGGVPTITPGGFAPGMKGIFEIYSFRPDGSYILWRDNENGQLRDSGTYKVAGNRVTLHGKLGGLVGTISGDGRSINIGGNVYELTGASPPQSAPAAESCRSNCGRMFTDCNAAGRPYSYCSSQVESCIAACR